MVWLRALEVGKYFRDFVKDTLTHLKNEQWNEDEKNIQLVKRSRYAEFNSVSGEIQYIFTSQWTYSKDFLMSCKMV